MGKVIDLFPEMTDRQIERMKIERRKKLDKSVITAIEMCERAVEVLLEVNFNWNKPVDVPLRPLLNEAVRIELVRTYQDYG